MPRKKTGLASSTKKRYIKSTCHCLILCQNIVGGLYTIISEGKFTQSDAIEKLANKDKISYSKAKNRIDYSIYHYLESKKDKYFLLNNISEYANTQAVTEICAEAFSVRENNEIAKTIISLIGDDWQ